MHEFQGVSISTHGASEYAQGRALPLRAIITIRTRTSCETCSQRERMEILVCDWHGRVYFARSKCTHHHKPQTTDVETRIDRVTSSLVGAQSLQSSSFSCPTECADHQSKCTLHHIVCADSMNDFMPKNTYRSVCPSLEPRILGGRECFTARIATQTPRVKPTADPLLPIPAPVVLSSRGPSPAGDF